jgi:hypothetical protein
MAMAMTLRSPSNDYGNDVDDYGERSRDGGQGSVDVIGSVGMLSLESLLHRMWGHWLDDHCSSVVT